MKRRHFIQQSVLTAAAITIPFSKMHGQTTSGFDTFTGTRFNEKTKDEISYEIVMYNDLKTNFSSIPIEKKIIKFTAYKKIEGSFKSYKVDLKATSIKMLDNKDGKTDDVYKIETVLLQSNSSEFELPKELNVKKMAFLYHTEAKRGGGENDTLTILDKKNEMYKVLNFKAKEADDDCFLTTACVHTLGKEDDCFELKTLRNFRDQYLKTNEEGRKLVQNYYEVAPQIVDAINIRGDKNEIYSEIYNQMILPTIHLIEDNNADAAIQVYQDYTRMLESKYM